MTLPLKNNPCVICDQEVDVLTVAATIYPSGRARATFCMCMYCLEKMPRGSIVSAACPDSHDMDVYYDAILEPIGFPSDETFRFFRNFMTNRNDSYPIDIISMADTAMSLEQLTLACRIYITNDWYYTTFSDRWADNKRYETQYIDFEWLARLFYKPNKYSPNKIRCMILSHADHDFYVLLSSSDDRIEGMKQVCMRSPIRSHSYRMDRRVQVMYDDVWELDEPIENLIQNITELSRQFRIGGGDYRLFLNGRYDCQDMTYITESDRLVFDRERLY